MRLFTGLSIPHPIRKNLMIMQGGVPGAKWVDPQNFHITLTFVGNTSDHILNDLKEALHDIRWHRFSITLAGAGAFDRKDDATHLWVGTQKNDALAQLKDKIDTALLKSRIPFEKRKYHPHVTLAHLHHADTEKMSAFIQDHNLFMSDPFEVMAFHLYRSHKTKNGSAYEMLESYPL